MEDTSYGSNNLSNEQEVVIKENKALAKSNWKILKRPLPPKHVFVTLFSFAVLLTGVFTGLYLQSKSYQETVTDGKNQSGMTEKTDTPFALEITSPLGDSLVAEGSVTFLGRTLPDTPVVMLSENYENTLLSDVSGNFSGEMVLEEGINSINIIAFSPEGEEKSVTLDVIYDEQVLGVKSDSDTSLKNSPKKTVSGQVQIVAPNEIGVKQTGHQISTYSIDENTSIVNERNKPLKKSDILPNVQTVIVSQDKTATSGADIRKALKVFIKTTNISPTAKLANRQALQGVIAELSGNDVRIVHQTQSNRSYFLTLDDNSKIKSPANAQATVADLIVGQRIVAAVSTLPGGGMLVKQIHIIPGKAVGIVRRLSITPQPTVQTLTPTVTPPDTISPDQLTPTILPSITMEISRFPTPD